MSYRATECGRCGKSARVDRLDVTRMGDPLPVYVDGREECSDPTCGHVCRICRRPPGDIHAAECALVVLAKLQDHCYVSREDCL